MKGTVRDAYRRIGGVVSVAQAALFVAIAYVFFLAPVRVVAGDAELKHYPAALLGFAFWAITAVVLAGEIR